MLITFQSRASADVLMFGEVAGRLLTLLGKDAKAGEGIFTVEQVPAAIDALRATIAADRKQQAASAPDDDEPDEDAPRGMAAPVSLAQRAAPLLDMLQAAQVDAVPVTWRAG